MWNLEEGRVTEQMVVTIPATPGNVFPGLNVQSKYGRSVRGYLGMAGSQSMECQNRHWTLIAHPLTIFNEGYLILLIAGVRQN